MVAKYMLDGGGGGKYRPRSGRGTSGTTSFTGTTASTTSPSASSSSSVDYSRPAIQSSPPPPPPTLNPSYGTNYGGGNGSYNTGGFSYPTNVQPISPAPAPAPIPEPISEEDWLAGDSAYQRQISEYDAELQDFLARLATKRSDFKEDYQSAMAGLNRNAEAGLENLGQDFTARGLAYSGMFADNRKEAEAGYERQRGNMTKSRDRAMAGFENQEEDKRSATKLARGNAREASLGRMARDQMF